MGTCSPFRVPPHKDVERHTADILHRQERLTFPLSELMNLDDVMIDVRRKACSCCIRRKLSSSAYWEDHLMTTRRLSGPPSSPNPGTPAPFHPSPAAQGWCDQYSRGRVHGWPTGLSPRQKTRSNRYSGYSRSYPPVARAVATTSPLLSVSMPSTSRSCLPASSGTTKSQVAVIVPRAFVYSMLMLRMPRPRPSTGT